MVRYKRIFSEGSKQRLLGALGACGRTVNFVGHEVPIGGELNIRSDALLKPQHRHDGEGTRIRDARRYYPS